MQTFAAAVFLLCGALVIWVLAGYPVLLWMLAFLRPRRVKKAPQRKTVSFLIPVHNGEAFLASKIQSIRDLDYPQELCEIVIVSDGSTDRTDEIAESFAGQRVRLIRNPPGGKAAALNRGLAEVRNEILVLTDVRQTLDRQSLNRLMECFADPTIGVVSGNLFIRDGELVQEADIGLYRRYETWIRTNLSSIASVIGASGCYYAMRRNLAKTMPADTLLDDMFLPLSAIFAGYRCVLEPSARCFDLPTALETEFRRKVRTLAGVYQLIGFHPALLVPWTSTGFNFLSLKMGRLLLPFAFVLLLISSFWLPEPWRTLALIGQALFYGIALLDLVIPETFPLKRLTSPFRSFIVLTAAAACAVSILFVPPRQLWKPTVVQNSRKPL